LSEEFESAFGQKVEEFEAVPCERFGVREFGFDDAWRRGCRDSRHVRDVNLEHSNASGEFFRLDCGLVVKGLEEGKAIVEQLEVSNGYLGDRGILLSLSELLFSVHRLLSVEHWMERLRVGRVKTGLGEGVDVKARQDVGTTNGMRYWYLQQVVTSRAFKLSGPGDDYGLQLM
jgi:hypothetical protein